MRRYKGKKVEKTPTRCPTCGKLYSQAERYEIRHGISLELQSRLNEALRRVDKRFDGSGYFEGGRFITPTRDERDRLNQDRLSARKVVRAQFMEKYGTKTAKQKKEQAPLHLPTPGQYDNQDD